MVKFISALFLLIFTTSCNKTDANNETIQPYTESENSFDCQVFLYFQGILPKENLTSKLSLYFPKTSIDSPFKNLLKSLTIFRLNDPYYPIANDKKYDFNMCLESNYKDLILLGSIFKLGTELSQVSKSINAEIDFNALKNSVHHINPSYMGQTAIYAYKAGCLSGYPIKNLELADFVNSYCKALELTNANGNSVAAVGQCFQSKLVQSDYECI